MLHNGVPNYNQSMGYYNYQHAAAHQYSAQPYSQPQNTFKEYEECKFTQAASYAQSSCPGGTDKVVEYSDDKVQHRIPEPKCRAEKLSSAANYKMVDFGSPEAHADPSQQTVGLSSPECAAKQTLPTFPWMINSSEDGKRRRQSYSRKQTLELEKEFCYSQYLTKKRRSELCHLLQLSEKQIKTWFQNRRMKKKKENEKQKVDIARSVDLHHNSSQESGEGANEFWNSPKSAVSPVKESYGVTNIPQYPQHAHRFYFNNNSYDVNFG